MLRFAPSPTGDMHIGNMRVAIFNYIVSKQMDKKFIVRIEDSDIKRNVKDKDKDIINLLELFNITYDNLIYQSDNIKFHRQFAMQMLIDKKAFCCFCDDNEIDKHREKAKKAKIAYRYSGKCASLEDDNVIDKEAPFSVRVKKPDSNIKFTDLLKGDFSFLPKDIDSFIIMRQNKFPTYNFACSVDDMISDVNLVIRGEDHISNTPKQILIRDCLDYNKTISYIHLPVILNENGKKMSKRDNNSSVSKLISDGFLPQAIANYLILLGGSFENEIFTIKEAISFFDINKISKASPKFDINKLKFINKKHILKMDDNLLGELVGYDSFGALAKLFLEEADTTNELKAKLAKVFSQKEILEGYENEFTKVKDTILNLKKDMDFTELKAYIADTCSLKGQNLFKPLRYLLTGSLSGPNLSEIYPHIQHKIKEIIR